MEEATRVSPAKQTSKDRSFYLYDAYLDGERYSTLPSTLSKSLRDLKVVVSSFLIVISLYCILTCETGKGRRRSDVCTFVGVGC